jgi:hypothetical protein
MLLSAVLSIRHAEAATWGTSTRDAAGPHRVGPVCPAHLPRRRERARATPRLGRAERGVRRRAAPRLARLGLFRGEPAAPPRAGGGQARRGRPLGAHRRAARRERDRRARAPTGYARRAPAAHDARTARLERRQPHPAARADRARAAARHVPRRRRPRWLRAGAGDLQGRRRRKIGRHPGACRRRPRRAAVHASDLGRHQARQGHHRRHDPQRAHHRAAEHRHRRASRPGATSSCGAASARWPRCRCTSRAR